MLAHEGTVGFEPIPLEFLKGRSGNPSEDIGQANHGPFSLQNLQAFGGFLSTLPTQWPWRFISREKGAEILPKAVPRILAILRYLPKPPG
jgi:hypothetical protein